MKVKRLTPIEAVAKAGCEGCSMYVSIQMQYQDRAGPLVDGICRHLCA